MDPERKPPDLEGVPGWRRLKDGAPHPEDLRDIVDAVLKVTKPERVLLFGSGARGEMSDDSDIDILVIDEAPGDTPKLKLELGNALPMGLRWTDVLVLTPAGLRKRLHEWEDETLADQRSERDAGRRRGHDPARLRQVEVATGTEANRAVEYAIKGVVMALDGRVDQRHNSRELAHHLQPRGEDVGMAQLDDVEPQQGRTPTPYEEFENPEFKDLSDEQTARILRAAATIVGNCERRVEELAREHNIKVELGVRAEGWSPPADVRDELEKRAARNVPVGSQAREPAEGLRRCRRGLDRGDGRGDPGRGGDDSGGRSSSPRSASSRRWWRRTRRCSTCCTCTSGRPPPTAAASARTRLRNAGVGRQRNAGYRRAGGRNVPTGFGLRPGAKAPDEPPTPPPVTRLPSTLPRWSAPGCASCAART